MSDPNRPDSVMLKGDAPRSNNNNQNGGVMPEFISSSSHPGIAFLHVVLKIAIVFVYLVLPLLSAASFTQLVIVVIMGAADFWIVKNLSGRFLVGLRWWIDFDEQGNQQWKFECKVDEKEISGASDKAFWWTLAFFTLVWAALLIINILKFALTQVTICAFCVALLGFNLYSYYKCSKVQKENVKRLLSQYGANAAERFMRGSIIAGFN